MKKIFLISASLLILSFFSACSEKVNPYLGYWKGESSMVFEVFTDNGTDFVIRNANGDLSATLDKEGSLVGKNALNMEYKMTVRAQNPDSAYYEFGGVTTGYERVSKASYDLIRNSTKK